MKFKKIKIESAIFIDSSLSQYNGLIGNSSTYGQPNPVPMEVEDSQESRCKYWATRPSLCLLCSLTLSRARGRM